jgi:hypothetical protein
MRLGRIDRRCVESRVYANVTYDIQPRSMALPTLQTVYEFVSMSGTSIEDSACLVTAVQPSVWELSTVFPDDVIQSAGACLATPPNPTHVVTEEKRTIPTRYIDIMLRRRRKR